jgi:hypothetical protein
MPTVEFAQTCWWVGASVIVQLSAVVALLAYGKSFQVWSIHVEYGQRDDKPVRFELIHEGPALGMRMVE